MTFGSGTWRRFVELYAARHEPEYLRPLAEGFWRTLLLLACIGAGAVVFFGIWQFWSVLSAVNTPPGSGVRPPPALNRVQLENTLGAIEQRRGDFNTLRSTVRPVVDPSK